VERQPADPRGPARNQRSARSRPTRPHLGRGRGGEEIARLAGRASTRTTEVVYRRELRPVITTGAEIMNQLFAGS